MSTLRSARIATIWQSLAAAYDWRLTIDPQVIVARASAYFATAAEVSDTQIRAVLIGYYNERLYKGLQNREDRAAQELMAICRQQIRKWELTQAQEEDVAYEAVKRVIERLDTIKQPSVLLAYILRILQREAQKVKTQKELVESEIEPSAMDRSVEQALLADTVEQSLIREQLLAQFQKKLPNLLQRLVVIRSILFGDKPRDIAADLGIPAPQIILAKSRGLARLRQDAGFMEFCRSLRDN